MFNGSEFIKLLLIDLYVWKCCILLAHYKQWKQVLFHIIKQ
jgi:hypothetical protein